MSLLDHVGINVCVCSYLAEPGFDANRLAKLGQAGQGIVQPGALWRAQGKVQNCHFGICDITVFSLLILAMCRQGMDASDARWCFGCRANGHVRDRPLGHCRRPLVRGLSFSGVSYDSYQLIVKMSKALTFVRSVCDPLNTS